MCGTSVEKLVFGGGLYGGKGIAYISCPEILKKKKKKKNTSEVPVVLLVSIRVLKQRK